MPLIVISSASLKSHSILVSFGLLVVALLVSFPRFGQFENEYAPWLSDSEMYYEMSLVFLGEQERFTEAYVEPFPHHYNRPLLPWIAGWLFALVPGLSLRAAFSVVNVLAATLIAVLMKGGIERSCPSWRYTWLPSLLFLTGFPQLNWGYHILTDTLGLATAMASTFFALAVLAKGSGSAGQRLVSLLGVFILSSLAFLTRETGWFAVITVGWCVLAGGRGRPRTEWLWGGAVLLALIAGKFPHSLYEARFGLGTPTLRPETLFAYNPVYWLDVFVKSGVAFHFAWFNVVWMAFIMLRKRSWLFPPAWIVGWTLAALAYNAAVYVHNDITLIGFPMRASFSLFPVIYFYTEAFFERIIPKYRPHFLAALFVLFHLAVGWLGVLLDPGVPGVTIQVVLQDVFGLTL